MNVQIDELQTIMEEFLPKKRFLHTQGVQYLASCLSMCYGESAERAMLAGLLHDNAKYIDFELAIKECERYQLPVSDVERRNPFLLHGKLGAYYAKMKYGVEDEEILSAITYHTTGKPNMTFLEKVIFLSDYIEPRRVQPTTPTLDVIRTTAFSNLDLAVYYALDNTVRYLNNTNKEIDELTVKTLVYYKKALNL